MHKPNNLLRGRYNNLYAKLGVSQDTSRQAIWSAYHVLERAYQPGGAYTDDTMHLAFTEISNAAEILCDPRTRRLYDRGYIDDTGRPTEAGLARACKTRTAALVTAIAAAGFAGVFLFNLWTPDSKGSGGGAGISKSPAELNDTAVASAKPDGALQLLVAPLHRTAVHADWPSAAAPSPARQELSREASAEKPDAKSLGGDAAQEANAEDYLPPERVDHAQSALADAWPGSFADPGGSRRPTLQRYSPRNGMKRPKRQAQRLQRREQAALSSPADPWVPYRLARGPAPPTLNTAKCLACLTGDRADCSKICP